MQPQHTEARARARVLIIDDDLALTKVLARVLSSEDFDVGVANDAEQGLRLAGEQRPALMIVDLHLPDMDGYAFIDACRAIPECAQVPIFLATGDGNARGTRQRIEDKGVVLILPKPFDLETLIAAIHGAVHSQTFSHKPARALEEPRGESPCG
jgi:DNA-binding response OmpR family regulator